MAERLENPESDFGRSRSSTLLATKTPSGVLSTAEAISLLANSMALSGNFGDGTVSDHDLASGLQGAVIKDDEKDVVVWKDYLANVMKKRGASWRGLYSACSEHVGE